MNTATELPTVKVQAKDSEAWVRESKSKGWTIPRLYQEKDKPFEHASRYGGTNEIRVPAPGRAKGGKKRIVGVWGLGEGRAEKQEGVGCSMIGNGEGDEETDEGMALTDAELVGKCRLTRLERRESIAEERYGKRRAEGRLGGKLRAEVERSPLAREVER